MLNLLRNPATSSRFLPCLLLGFLAFGLPAASAIDAPVSPNAQPGVSTLLNFLNTMSGQYMLSGQQERSWDLNGLDYDVNYIVQNTGKTPAVRGFDFLMYVYGPSTRVNETASERAITWAQNGGIVTFCCHMFMNLNSTNGQPQFYTPGSNGNPQGTNFDIRQAVINGTPENTEYLAKIDICATELKKLRDANVPVIWRPFHECGGTWFWWSRYGATPFKQAWVIMFNRLTQVHGLTNLIWEFNPVDSGATMTGWYPGDEYVDMISLDVYPTAGTHPTYATDSQTMRNFKNGRKVVAMSECGSIPDPDLFGSNTYWSYFCTWNGFEDDLSRHTVAFLQKVYNHAKVITFDELPAAGYVPFALSITSHPVESTTVISGQNVSLSVVVTGTPAPTYQWQRLPAGSGSWANLSNGGSYSGVTTATLTISSVTGEMSGDQFRCIATNTSSNATSNAGSITVIVAPSDAVITITVENATP